MRIPVPNTKLVAFTLAGALLTAIVAGALAVPFDDLTQPGDQTDLSETPVSVAPQQVAPDVPTPNEDFTPAIQQQSGYAEEEHEEAEDNYEEDETEDEEYEEDEDDYKEDEEEIEDREDEE